MEFPNQISSPTQGPVNYVGPTNIEKAQLDCGSIDTNPKDRLEEAGMLYRCGDRNCAEEIYASFIDKIADLRAAGETNAANNLEDMVIDQAIELFLINRIGMRREAQFICNILARSKNGDIINNDVMELCKNCSFATGKIGPSALEIITKAAKKPGYPRTAFWLGVRYKEGDCGLPQDFEKALAFFILTALRGNKDSKKQIVALNAIVSMACRANAFPNLYGCPKDIQYRPSECPNVQYMLALLFNADLIEGLDKTNASEMMEFAAGNGHAKARAASRIAKTNRDAKAEVVALSIEISNVLGVQIDLAEEHLKEVLKQKSQHPNASGDAAIKLAELALEKHDNRGLFNIFNTDHLIEAENYYKVARDCYKSLENFKDNQKYIDANHKYLTMASERGNSEAQLELGKLYFEGTEKLTLSIDKCEKAAMGESLLQKAMQSPNVKIAGEAALILANAHKDSGTRKSTGLFEMAYDGVAESLKYYKISADFGNQDATLILEQTKIQAAKKMEFDVDAKVGDLFAFPDVTATDKKSNSTGIIELANLVNNG